MWPRHRPACLAAVLALGAQLACGQLAIPSSTREAPSASSSGGAGSRGSSPYAGAPAGADALAMAGAQAPGSGYGGGSSSGDYSSAMAPGYASGGFSSSAGASPGFCGPLYTGSSSTANDDSAIQDKPETALAAKMLLEGPDMWPFSTARQSLLASTVQNTLIWPSFVTVTGVEEGPWPGKSGASPGRSLLAVNSSVIATVQMDAGTSDLITTICSDLSYQLTPSHNTMLAAVQAVGIPATNLTVLSVQQIVPLMPWTTGTGELVGALLGAALVTGFFIFSMVFLELEKRRACAPLRPEAGGYQQLKGDGAVAMNPLYSPKDSGMSNPLYSPKGGYEGEAQSGGLRRKLSSPRGSRTPRVPLEERGVLRVWDDPETLETEEKFGEPSPSEV